MTTMTEGLAFEPEEDRLPAPALSGAWRERAETSQVPFTPVTREALATLEPAERIAFTVASAQVARGDNPPPNTTAALLLTIQRLITEAAGPAPLIAADPETELANAQNAIGQVIKHALSWRMQGARLDATAVSRVLLDVLKPWTGMPARSGGEGEAPNGFRQRPGDQPLPVANDGPSMHDLVIKDLECWPESDEVLAAVRSLLEERKRIGLERYGALLQANNGRDARRDLLEELADAAVYVRQLEEERGDGPGSGEVFEASEHIVSALAWAVQICEASHG
jgi:hypothetical protein